MQPFSAEYWHIARGRIANSFDRGVLATCHVTDRGLARADRLSVEMDRAAAA
jgi:hypothetical protein